MAGAVAYLVSPLSGSTTGTSIAVDGGMQTVEVWGSTVIGGGHFDKACVTNHAGPLGQCVDGVRAERGKLEGKALPWPLGGRVLRAETAVLVGLAAVHLRWGDFRPGGGAPNVA